MPSFKGQLTDQQIADVASYVVKATGGTPVTLLELPPAFPRSVAAFAFDLDRTLIAEDAVLRPRTLAAHRSRARATGAHVIIVTGRMFRSTRPVPRRGGARRSGRLLPGRRRGGSGDRRVPPPRAASPRASALEAIDAVIEAGFHINCYVDDNLYVAEGDARGARVRRLTTTSRSTRSATCATWLTTDPTKLVAVGDPDGARRARGRAEAALRGTASSSRSRCRTSSSSRTRT